MLNLFLDIETIPNTNISPELMACFDKKKKEEETFEDKAALHAEYGKIVCISLGWDENNQWQSKSFVWSDEALLLAQFSDFLKGKNVALIGHNIKWFDLPFLIKRYWINSIPLPAQLQLKDKKPWEMAIIDTIEIWKTTSRDFTSLEVICLALWLPNPKGTTNGAEVYDLYQANNFEAIATYCEWDVKAVAEVYKRVS